MSAKLTDFPRPNVAVDLAVLTVRPTTDRTLGELVTLVLERTESPAGSVLPGRFIRERETIQATVDAMLTEKLGLSPTLGGSAPPRLLRVFDDPDRDERSWVISIAHMVALPWEYVADAVGEWTPVGPDGSLRRRRRLLFDHPTIIREAVWSTRDRYETEPDPYHLLTRPFTLRDLRHLHEAVLGESVRKDTFNRRMRPQLDASDEEPESRPVGRPARYYRHLRARSSFTEALWRLPRAD